MISGEVVSVIIFMIGCFTIMVRRDIVKTSIGIGLMTGGVVLNFLTSGSEYQLAPIGERAGVVADPLPQALMITDIIIGVATTAVALAIFIKLYKRYDTARWDTALKKHMEDE